MNTDRNVTSRAESNATKVPTTIWKEVPSEASPYVSKQSFCHGYDLMELLQKCTYIEVLFLLFRGEIPTKEEAELLERLMIAFINPGPRHPATYAAMNAGVGRTRKELILPIGLSVLSGEHLGGKEVQESMKYLMQKRDEDPRMVAQKLIENHDVSKFDLEESGDIHIVPGFGTRFGTTDPLTHEIAEFLLVLSGSGPTMEWAKRFVAAMSDQKMGWLPTGVVAAVLCDLGFHYHAGAGVYQLISGPGILAHGLEMAKRTRLEFPFPTGDNYIIHTGE